MSRNSASSQCGDLTARPRILVAIAALIASFLLFSESTSHALDTETIEVSNLATDSANLASRSARTVASTAIDPAIQAEISESKKYLESLFAEINRRLPETAHRNVQLSLRIFPNEPERLSRINSKVNGKGILTLEIGFSEDGIRNWMVILEELSRLNVLLTPPTYGHRGNKDLKSIFSREGIVPFEIAGSRGFRHPMILIEAQANAELGSVAAQKRLASFEAEVLKVASASLDSFEPFKRATRSSFVERDGRTSPVWRRFLSFLRIRKVSLPVASNNTQPTIDEMRAAAREYLRLRTGQFETSFAHLSASQTATQRLHERKWDEWKKSTGTLEQLESAEYKLNDLLKANDRAGVRRLIEAYLPWPMMEPVEASAWRRWLEAIEHPDPKNTIIAFRGVDDMDKPQRFVDPNGLERFGFMSTLLTRNQGNYTRRLRSLTTMRQRLGDGFLTDKFQDRSPTIVNMMSAHSQKPEGSPFISFTPNLEIAEQFVKETGGLLVAKIDARRMFTNFASSFTTEAELLVPLVVFPDEVIEYRKGYNRFDHKAELMASLQAKGAMPKPSDVHRSNAAIEYFGDGIKDFAQIITDTRRQIGITSGASSPGSPTCRLLFQ